MAIGDQHGEAPSEKHVPRPSLQPLPQDPICKMNQRVVLRPLADTLQQEDDRQECRARARCPGDPPWRPKVEDRSRDERCTQSEHQVDRDLARSGNRRFAERRDRKGCQEGNRPGEA